MGGHGRTSTPRERPREPRGVAEVTEGPREFRTGAHRPCLHGLEGGYQVNGDSWHGAATAPTLWHGLQLRALPVLAERLRLDLVRISAKCADFLLETSVLATGRSPATSD